MATQANDPTKYLSYTGGVGTPISNENNGNYARAQQSSGSGGYQYNSESAAAEEAAYFASEAAAQNQKSAGAKNTSGFSAFDATAKYNTGNKFAGTFVNPTSAAPSATPTKAIDTSPGTHEVSALPGATVTPSPTPVGNNASNGSAQANGANIGSAQANGANAGSAQANGANVSTPITAKSADGAYAYTIGSEAGKEFINGAQNGSTINGADGSTWSKDANGNVTITDKYGVTYNVKGTSVATKNDDANAYYNAAISALDSWLTAAKAQSDNSIDYNTQKSIDELTRALEDAQATFQQNQAQIAAQGQYALDNRALYAEARGDKGGIGQAQYNSIMNTMAINQQTVKTEQTKLATDTQRQIADLRAQGEYEKADAVLQLTQTYLGQLLDLQQWAANYAVTADQFDESVRQWEAEYEMAVANLTGEYRGTATLSAQEAALDRAYKAAQIENLYAKTAGTTGSSGSGGASVVGTSALTADTDGYVSTMSQIDAYVKAGYDVYDAVLAVAPGAGITERSNLESAYKTWSLSNTSLEDVFVEAYTNGTSPQSVLNKYKDVYGDVSKDYAAWASGMDAQYDQFYATGKLLLDRKDYDPNSGKTVNTSSSYYPQVYATILDQAPAAIQAKLLNNLAAYNSGFKSYLVGIGVYD